MSFFTGTPAKYEQVSTLADYQRPLHRQQVKAAQAAYPMLQDYYQNLMSSNPADFQAMAAPEMRQFREQTIPSLAEQFAGMGSGGLSSSGFRNAAVSAGADLSERLGALRAQLRQAGASGLQGLAGQGLQNVTERVMTDPGSQGFLAPLASGIGSAIGGPLLGAAAGGVSNWLSDKFGKTSPISSSGPSAIPNTNIPKFNAPSFQYNMR